jgi:hypothetical protein
MISSYINDTWKNMGIDTLDRKNIGRYILIYKHKYIYYIHVYQCLNESESKTFSKRGEDDAHLINTQGEDKTSHKSRNRG